MSVFREVLGSIRRGSTSARYCPKCGSVVESMRESTPGYGLTPKALDGWVLPVKYVCSKCGYNGVVAVEEETVDSGESD